MKRIVGLLFVAVCALSACGGGGSGDAATPSDPVVAKGKELAQNSCGGCHTADGESGAGPTWKGLAGSEVTLEGGRKVTADDAYLLRSIQDPNAEIVVGYPNTMAFSVPKGSISDEDAQALVAYIKSLSS